MATFAGPPPTATPSGPPSSSSSRPHRKALDLLEPLLRKPYYLSPGWLRIDPTFDPIRKHPRFQRLAGDGT